VAKQSRLAVGALGLLLTLSLALSGCGMANDRLAEGADMGETAAGDGTVAVDETMDDATEPAADDPAEPEADPDPADPALPPSNQTDKPNTAAGADEPNTLGEMLVRGANRGTRICFTNNSSLKIFTKFTKYDRADQEFILQKGDDDLCGEGAFTLGDDVVAVAEGSTWRSGASNIQQYYFEGTNPWLGAPSVTVYTPYSGRLDPSKLSKVGDLCFSNSGWDENETRTWDDGVLKLAVKRSGDSSGFKEFKVTFTDTDRPDKGDFGWGNKCGAGDYP
jgi:hypothetical protein